MPSHLVGGVRLPDAVSGHRVLELCNTRAGWGEPAPKEYLVDATAVLLWAGEHSYVGEAELPELRGAYAHRPAIARRVHRDVLAYREALYRVLTATQPATADLAALTAAYRAAARGSALVAPRGDAVRLEAGGGPRTPLHRIVLATTAFLDAGERDAVRRCPGEGCGWLFLDRGRGRRWCVMAICGNRAKARAYSARRRRSNERKSIVRATG